MRQRRRVWRPKEGADLRCVRVADRRLHRSPTQLAFIWPAAAKSRHTAHLSHVDTWASTLHRAEADAGSGGRRRPGDLWWENWATVSVFIWNLFHQRRVDHHPQSSGACGWRPLSAKEKRRELATQQLHTIDDVIDDLTVGTSVIQIRAGFCGAADVVAAADVVPMAAD